MSALCSICRALNTGRTSTIRLSAIVRLLLMVMAVSWFMVGENQILYAAVPQIRSQPLNRNAIAGSGHAFQVAAIGTPPLRYQWRLNGTAIAGATNSTYLLAAIQANAAGLYSVVVSNLEGSVASLPARLTVRNSSDPVYPVPALGWSYLYGGADVESSLTAALDGSWNHELDSWLGDGRGAGNGMVGGLSSSNGIVTIEDGVTSAAGGTFNNRRFYFTHNLAQEISVTNAGSLLDDGVTLTFRARLTPSTDPLLEITNAPSGLVNNSDGKGMFGLRQSGSSGMIVGFSLGQAVEDVSASSTYSFGQAGLHMNQLNGDSRTNNVDPGEPGSVNLLPLDPTVFHEFWITIQDNGSEPGTHRVSIFMDGSLTPSVFNVTAGTGFDGPAMNYLALGMGSSGQRGAVAVDFFGYRPGVVVPSAFNQPVGISSAPVNQFVALGQQATFQVGVTGTPPYSFQWYRNGVMVSGATNAAYTVGPIVAGDAGASLVVVVANEFNSVTSSPPAQIYFAGAPAITAHPFSQTVTNGDAMLFSVVVNSAVTPSYQWRRAGSALANETNASLVLTLATPNDAGSYDVVVSTASGSVTSQVATLTVVTFDYGDAPDSEYRTLRSSNGARHRVVSGVHLGAMVDVDLDGRASLQADGDDSDGSDDDDGVVFQNEWVAGKSALLQITASTAGMLSAWMDWDHNGNWNGPGEQFISDAALSAGVNSVRILIPESALAGNGYARFRFSTTGDLPSYGPAGDGEVEDYLVNVAPRSDLSVSGSASGNLVSVGGELTYTVIVRNQGPSIAPSVVLTNVLPAGVGILDVSTSQGSCFQVADRIDCDLGTLPGGASAVLELRMRPTIPSVLTFSSRAESATIDPVSANNSSSVSITALQPPAITQQPLNRTLTNGATTVIVAGASGSGPLFYQWYFNGAPQIGQTNAAFSISSASLANQGNYFVRVTNLVGSVDSSTVALTVLTPPSIVTQPLGATNFAGSSASFSVVATGTEPLFYQWRFNGSTKLVDEVTSSFGLADVRLTNAGAYSVVISNAAGVITSAVANLAVIELDFGDAPSPYPTSLAQDGARHRLVGGIRLGATADFEPAAQLDSLATGDDQDGVDDEDGVVFNSPVRVGQTVSITVNASVNGVLNAWMDYNRNGSWADNGEQILTNRAVVAGNNTITFVVPASANAGLSFARFRFSTASGLSFVGEALNGEVEDYSVAIEAVSDVSISRMTQNNPVAVGGLQVYAIVVSNAGPVTATGVVLTDVLPAGVSYFSAASSRGGCVHSAGTITCSIGTLSVGGIATVTINALVGAEGSLQNTATVGASQVDLVPSNNSSSSVALALIPPGFVTQPASREVTIGASATFNVVAAGTNLRYQWLRDGIVLPGATLPTLTVANVVPGNAGAYSVRITNEVGLAISTAAVLTVLQPVLITMQPAGQTVLSGSTVSLTVTASGTGPLGYQWEYNGAELLGQTGPSLVLSEIQTNQSGVYRVRVENALGSALSSPATVTVYIAPTFTADPFGQTNPTGGAVTFTAGVIGTEPLRLQWYFNRTNLIAAQTNATLTFTALQTSRSGDYTLVATNIAGVATSAVARLAVFDMDFGDAPAANGYPTTFALNGARHRVVPGIRLGAQIDFEADGVSSVTATGDDSSGLDDEDGVVIPSGILIGQTALFSVNASTTGFLDAWIDFNGNGTWNDPGEQVAASRVLTAGVNAVPLAISPNAVAGTRMARFRFSTAGGLSFDGFAPDGEVEDHQVPMQAAMDMQLGITDSADPVSVSTNFTYTITVTNRGPARAGLVWVTNALPSSFSFVSAATSGGRGFCDNVGSIVYCLLDDMLADEIAWIDLTVRANAAGTYTNRAWVFSISGLADANREDNTNTQSTVVVGAPVRFRNLSTINVADATPGVPGKGNPYPSVINVSGITSAIFKVTVTVSNITHDFAKDFDLLLVGPRGQNVMLMSDAGASALAGVSLVFDDLAPAPLPSFGVIASGTYRPGNYGVAVDVFPGPAPVGPFGSTLDTFNNTDPNGPWSLYVVDEIVGGLGYIQGGWGLSLTTADPIADIAVTAAASTASVALGSNLTYSVTLTNRGPAIASSVRLTNSLPSGVSFVAASATIGSCVNESGNVICDFGTLGVGNGAAAALTVTPNVSGLLTNSIQGSASQLDLNVSNNRIEVVTPARPSTDLVVGQVPSTNLVLLGQNFIYTLHVTNRGPNAATNIRLVDTIPGTANFVSAISARGSCSDGPGVVECNISTLAPGEQASVVLTLTPTLVSSMTNLVVVSSDEIDSIASNNESANVLVANVAADLAVSVSGGPVTALLNSVVTYNLTVTNRGPSSALGAALTNVLPAGFAFVSASSSVGSCEFRSGAIVCSIFVLDVESSAQIVIQVRPTVSGLSTLPFGVGGSSVDFVPENNAASSSIEVRQAPFIITQPQGRTVTSGASVTMSVVAGGYPAPTYQWSVGGTDIPNAVGSSFSIPIATFASRGQYRVRAVNSVGSVTSFVASVNVLVPPTISDVASQQIDEDTVTAQIPFVVGDQDTLIGSLVVTASSSDQTLVSASGISLGGSLSNRTVRIAPATNRFGVATITLRVSDPNGLSAIDTFQVTVNPINDLPAVSGFADMVMDANSVSAPIGFTVQDIESPADLLVVTAASTNPDVFPPSSFQIQGSGTNRSLVLSPAANRSGTATITVTTADPNGGSTSRSFLATVKQTGGRPEIVVPPASQTVTNGARVTFDITVTGSLPIVYQWKYKGLSLPGATNASLVLPSVGSADAGAYAVVVSNGSGSVTSAPVILRVLVPATIMSFIRNGGGVEITFGTMLDLVYVVDYSETLMPEFWHPLKAIAGTGRAVMVRDTNAPVTARFYRVRVLVAPTITSVRPVGGRVEIAFSTYANLSYTVETSDGLETSVWEPLTTVPGTGDIVVVPDSGPATSRRLYRVRVE